MTDDEIGRLAVSYARRLSNQWRGRAEAGDLVASCWKGIRKAMAAGILPGKSMWMKAKFQAIDDLRIETAHRIPLKARIMRARQFSPKFSPNWYAEEANIYVEDQPDKKSRLLEIWAETKSVRSAGMIQDRVYLYLYAVEGWLMREIGEAVGRSEPWICSCINRLRREINARMETPVPGAGGGRDARGRAGEGRRGGGEGEGDPAAVQPAAHPEGDPVVRITSVVGEAGDAPGVAGGGRVPGVEGTDATSPGRVGGDVPGEGVPAGELVAVRSDGKAPRRTRRSTFAVIASTEPPSAAARKAAALRETMFDSLGREDVDEVMAAVKEKAKAGDMKAAELFFKLLGMNPPVR